MLACRQASPASKPTYLAQPVGGGGLVCRKGLDLARVGQMGPHAEIDEWSALVHRRLRAVRNLVADQTHLKIKLEGADY